jgi:hypothetical protein
MAAAAEVVAVMAAAVVEIINHQSSYSLPIPSFTKGFFYDIIRAVDFKKRKYYCDKSYATYCS